MASSTISVDLPEPLKAYVDARVDAGSYGTPSDFLRELLLDDRDRHLTRLEDHLDFAMQGRSFDISDEELEGTTLVKVLRARLGATP